MRVFRQSLDNIERRKEAIEHNLELHALGTIKDVKLAVEYGLVQSIRTLLSGEIVGDLLAIARERLQEDSESAKNISAVLVAAAFEDTMRTMGSLFAGLQGRPKLDSVIGELKDKQLRRRRSGQGLDASHNTFREGRGENFLLTSSFTG